MAEPAPESIPSATPEEPPRERAILRAVAFAAERFLTEPIWEAAVDEVLARLGEAAGVSRVWLAQTRMDSQGLRHGGLSHEWAAPGVEPRLDDPTWHHYTYDQPDATRWAELLHAGRPVVGRTREFPDAERADLEPLGVKSILVVPMLVNDEWIGHVGFDECRTERRWFPPEIDALTAAAATLGAAIARRRAEGQILAAEDRFRTLVEQLPAVTHISGLDPTSSTVYMSPQVEDLLGYTPEEWMADSELWIKVLHPEDRDRMIADNLDHIHTGVGGGQEYRMIARDGRVVWVFEDVTVMRDADGSPRYSQGVWLDITKRKEAEHALRETEARYRALVEQVPAVTYTDLIGEDDRMIYVSPQAERLVGYTAEEWEADPDLWERMIHPDDLERVLALDKECIRTGHPYAAEYRFVTKDGRAVWVHDESVRMPSPPGEPQVWQGVIVDVTARREARDTLRFQGQLLEAVQDAVIATDGVGVITYWNRFAEKLFGWTADEALGRDVRQILLATTDAAITGEIIHTLTERREWVGEFDIQRRDGSPLTIRSSISPVRGGDGEVTGAIAVSMDVTERRMAEQALRNAFEREREISQRLRAVDDMKNTFLQAVSHELRTPLSAILGFALTLEREEVGLSPDESRELIHRLAANARKLERLLSDLLDLDRLSRGILEPRRRPTDAGELVRRVIEGMELTDERPIDVVAVASVANLDPAKVERIVENLVSNAVRHTPPGTPVWIRVEEMDGGLMLQVDDAGPGVPDDMKQVIFEPFRQAPAARPHSPGVGIGLTLVARFAELHGGRAWVERREAGGSSFRVYLPGAYPRSTGAPTSEPYSVQDPS